QKVPNRDMSSNLSRYAETVPTLLDLDARFRLMDSVEGYMQVLTLAAPTVESVASPEVAVDLCRFANDEMAELVEKYPDRFAAAIAALPLNDLDASLEEIDRAIRDLRLRGIQMYSDVNGMPLDAEALYPIYEKMERYNLPILIHPKRSPALPDYPGEENSRYRAWTKLCWPWPLNGDVPAGLRRVMERFPNLKIVTHHCGGVIPYLAAWSGTTTSTRCAWGTRTSSSPQAARILPPHVLRHRQQRLSRRAPLRHGFRGHRQARLRHRSPLLQPERPAPHPRLHRRRGRPRSRPGGSPQGFPEQLRGSLPAAVEHVWVTEDGETRRAGEGKTLRRAGNTRTGYPSPPTAPPFPIRSIGGEAAQREPFHVGQEKPHGQGLTPSAT
ncbi:MAG: amidohydrolase family protein, partial [Bilophila wadsworthia]